MSCIGIIAGSGKLPQRLISACERDNKSYFVLALKGQTDKKTVKDTPHKWVKLGETSKSFRVLKDAGVDTLVMAGSVKRPSIFDMKPDLRTIQLFGKIGIKALGDDGMLRAVKSELETEGFKIIGAHEIEPDILTPLGVLTKKLPSDANNSDINYGIKTIKKIGELDIGQAAVVQQGVVLAIEAVEGTDSLIKRCKNLHRKKGHGGVLVKGCKPLQDRNLDLPAIGLKTLENAYSSGFAGIAIEARASIMLDRDEVIKRADKLNMFIIGFENNG